MVDHNRAVYSVRWLLSHCLDHITLASRFFLFNALD